MKTILTLLFPLLFSFGYAQQNITASFYLNASPQPFSSCDCKDEINSVKVSIPTLTSMDGFDRLQIQIWHNGFKYAVKEVFNKSISNQGVLNYILVSSDPKSYGDFGYNYKDFCAHKGSTSISVKIVGEYITGYQEKYDDYTRSIIKTPIYGSPQLLAESQAVKVEQNPAAFKGQMTKVFLGFGLAFAIVGGVFAISYL